MISFNILVLFSEHKQNECINSLEYKYDKHYHPYSSRADVNQTFLTINWKPIKKQSCLSITYFHSWNSEMEITMSISDENNTLITSTILEKHVSVSLSFNILNYEQVWSLKIVCILYLFYTIFICNDTLFWKRYSLK